MKGSASFRCSTEGNRSEASGIFIFRGNLQSQRINIFQSGKVYIYKDDKIRFQKVALYFKPEVVLYKFRPFHWCSNGGSSVEGNCEFVSGEGIGRVRCLIWAEQGFGGQITPMNFKIISYFIWTAVWVNLFSSRLRVIWEICRLKFVLTTEKMWYLRCCSGRLYTG